MSEKPKTHAEEATIKDQAIEERRKLLRQALHKQPDDSRLQAALKQLIEPYYVRRAARRGIFICYARDDELFALDLTTDLRKLGVPVFMDEMDVSDDEDSEWGAEVGNALRNCGAMLLILSPAGLQDAEVQGERIYFLKNGKVVIPVIARRCSTEGLEMVIPPIDFEENYQAGLKQLLELLMQPKKASTQ
jgi:TIR domain